MDPVQLLCNYVNNKQTLQVDEEMQKDSMETQYKNIQSSLLSLGFPSLGNLALLPKLELEKTNKCLQALLNTILANSSAKKQLDKFLTGIQIMDEKEQEIEQLKAQLKVIEAKALYEKEELISKEQQTLKKYSNMQAQYTFYQNEIVKRDKEIARLKELIHTTSTDSYIEITTPLKHSFVSNKNYNDPLVTTLTKGYERNIQELKSEVREYQELYKRMQEEIESIIALKKPEVKKQIKQITDSLYNLPTNTAINKILDIFKENLNELKLSLEDKIKEPSVLKEIDNYSEILRNQAKAIKEQPKRSLRQHEFDNIRKLIANNKKLLEENKKIIVISVHKQ